MRYTRYDYKKKKSDNFFLWLVVVILLSIFLGVGIYNIFLSKAFGGEAENQTIENSNKSLENNKEEESSKDFCLIQCGVFSTKDNADAIIKTIPAQYPSFIYEEEGKYKIIAGIYSKSDGDNISNSLTAANISNFKITCKIDENNDDNKIKAEIIEGYLKIINKLFEKDVKSIQTSEFKKWTSEMYDKLSQKTEEVDSLFNNINQLPEEYGKDNVNESLKVLADILLKYKAS